MKTEKYLYLLSALASDSKFIPTATVGALFSISSWKSGSKVERGRERAWKCIFYILNRIGKYKTGRKKHGKNTKIAKT